tara:strand:+ start:830 stop:1033 length:204 start_codon:yes stop_codon:yes gene_type:complete
MRYTLLALCFVFISGCSSIPGYPTSIAIKIGEKCELVGDNILLSSWIWFYDARDPESLTATKEACPK